MEDWIWVTWEKHRRTRGLCVALNIRLFEKNLRWWRIVKHPYLMLWTFSVLVAMKPRGLIVQNPSIILSLWVVLLRPIFGFVLVVDSHNGGLGLDNEVAGWAGKVYRFVQKFADLTIVTNSHLAEFVKRNGGRPFVLEDSIPLLPEVKKDALSGKYNVVCICTFSDDEPYREVIAAAGLLDKSYVVYVTGNSKKLPRDMIEAVPENLILAGFLPDEKYLELLSSADVIIDLTYRDYCLVCGAYEAVALEKPMILSDWGTLRDHFSKGVIYTKNESCAIAEAVMTAVRERSNLKSDVKLLRIELLRQWAEKKGCLVVKLRSLLS